LRHVTDPLPYVSGPQAAAFAGELYVSAGRIEQTAQHLDGGRFAGSIRSQKSVNFPISDLKAEVGYGGERTKLFGEIGCADRDLAAQMPVVVGSWKRDLARLLPQAAQRGQSQPDTPRDWMLARVPGSM
jgi:hypothetical protein